MLPIITSAGNRLAVQRRKKGLTQEQLSELTGITTRTIQRIEGGKVQPQAHTLKLLASALEMDFADLAEPTPLSVPDMQPATAAANQLALLHALPLVGLFLPFANIIAPLVLWLQNKEVHAAYDRQGRQVLNFQLTLTLVAACAVVLVVILFPVGFALIMLVYGFAIVMAAINVKKALSCRPAFYPLSIRFLSYSA